MSLSLVKSKRIRSGHKAHVRRVVNEGNELAGNYDSQNPNTEAESNTIQVFPSEEDGDNC